MAKSKVVAVTVDECPNCKNDSLATLSTPLMLHKQCKLCGYAVYNEHGGLDANDKAIIRRMIVVNPVGCATLKLKAQELPALVSLSNDTYESFIEYLHDNQDAVEYCILSSYKDDKIIESDLMRII